MLEQNGYDDRKHFSMDRQRLLENPYRPGAGHEPPLFAGRHDEQKFFRRVLFQNPIMENILITGLRGMGKTVLLDSTRKVAEEAGWLWVGNDLSESASLSEERLALRILTDLSTAIADKMSLDGSTQSDMSQRLNQRLDRAQQGENQALTFDSLKAQFERAPGLPSDRLKAVLLRVTTLLQKARFSGLILAYDEAQCLSDHAERNEFPMSMLIETVCALQKREGVSSCLLILSGLPHVYDALTATRTYTERMFHVMTLDRLTWDDTRAALLTPLAKLMPPLRASRELLAKAVELTGGYPYLIQFVGKELVEQILENGGTLTAEEFPSSGTLDRLDAGIFAARWNKTTDRQREFLQLIASRPDQSGPDFSANEIIPANDAGGFAATANQMLLGLTDRGLIYRTRHGRYAFTVPMSEAMILRRQQRDEDLNAGWGPPQQREPQAHPMQAGFAEAPAEAPKPKKSRGWFR